ncbi:MAG: hypothetical protein KM310_09530 [Clostridiales bacterium]|nr:hypothetical protein [Clostridiales bacterium]
MERLAQQQGQAFFYALSQGHGEGEGPGQADPHDEGIFSALPLGYLLNIFRERR